jgi:pectate lyase
MKRVFLFLSSCLMFSMSISAQNIGKPVGWATQGSGVTGGGNATPITVTSFKDLKSQAESSGAKVIYVKGTLGSGYSGSSGDMIQIAPDKTIIGYPGALLNASIRIIDSKNVIVRNIKVMGPPSNSLQGYDNVTIMGSSNIWFDHCEIIDGQDGNFDVTQGSDNVTATWCIFTYTRDGTHNMSNLIGGNDNEPKSVGKLNVTLQYCWFYGCADRTPRARFGKIHVANCYMSKKEGLTTSSGSGVGFKANMRIENCVYEGINNSVKILEGTAEGCGEVIDCQFINCTGGKKQQSVYAGGYTVFTPPYTLDLSPTAQVKSLVMSGAGANLNLVTDVATTAHSGATLAPMVTLSGSDFAYVTLNNSYQSGKTLINLLDIAGRAIMSDVRFVPSSSSATATINLKGLKSGVYFVNIRDNNQSVTQKMILQ